MPSDRKINLNAGSPVDPMVLTTGFGERGAQAAAVRVTV